MVVELTQRQKTTSLPVSHWATLPFRSMLYTCRLRFAVIRERIRIPVLTRRLIYKWGCLFQPFKAMKGNFGFRMTESAEVGKRPFTLLASTSTVMTVPPFGTLVYIHQHMNSLLSWNDLKPTPLHLVVEEQRSKRAKRGEGWTETFGVGRSFLMHTNLLIWFHAHRTESNGIWIDPKWRKLLMKAIIRKRKITKFIQFSVQIVSECDVCDQTSTYCHQFFEDDWHVWHIIVALHADVKRISAVLLMPCCFSLWWTFGI